MVQFSIIFPAFNEALEIKASLDAAREAIVEVGGRGECIVVDNNSTDETRSIAEANGADLVVFEPENQIARARNAGASAASGKIFIFVDADTRINPTLLQRTLEAIASGQVVGGGSTIAFENPINWLGRFSIKAWELISRVTKIAAGSYVFCAREAFEAVGGFDEKLYASEEVRFSRRVKRWGAKQGMRFIIITGCPALTSARKLEWYSGPQIFGWMLRMMVMPFAVRSRKLCSFWYTRPDKT